MITLVSSPKQHLPKHMQHSVGTSIFGLTETIFCKSQILHNVDYTTVCLLFYVVIVLGSELDSMEN